MPTQIHRIMLIRIKIITFGLCTANKNEFGEAFFTDLYLSTLINIYQK